MIYKFYTYGLEKLILELLSYLTVFWLNYHSVTDSGKKRKETRKKERKKKERRGNKRKRREKNTFRKETNSGKKNIFFKTQ